MTKAGQATPARPVLADNADISGATATAYTLADADEGAAVKVPLSFMDDAGNEEELTSAATKSVVVPLTASLHDVPESHDGVSPFTLELRFNEELKLSYKKLRDHAFIVTGGTIQNAQRISPATFAGGSPSCLAPTRRSTFSCQPPPGAAPREASVRVAAGSCPTR